MMHITTEVMIPEIEEIVKFYAPELVEEIARETGFMQRGSKSGRIVLRNDSTKDHCLTADENFTPGPTWCYRDKGLSYIGSILGPFHLFNAINLAKATKNASALWIRTCLVICFVINSLHGDQDEPVMQFMIPNTI